MAETLGVPPEAGPYLRGFFEEKMGILISGGAQELVPFYDRLFVDDITQESLLPPQQTELDQLVADNTPTGKINKRAAERLARKMNQQGRVDFQLDMDRLGLDKFVASVIYGGAAIAQEYLKKSGDTGDNKTDDEEARNRAYVEKLVQGGLSPHEISQLSSSQRFARELFNNLGALSGEDRLRRVLQVTQLAAQLDHTGLGFALNARDLMAMGISAETVFGARPIDVANILKPLQRMMGGS